MTLFLALALLAAGCESGSRSLVAPDATLAPYESRGQDVLWAVVPLANESGTSTVDALAVSDQVVASCAEIRGVSALSINRTIAAMRALELPTVETPGDARALADALGADGIVVGIITAYDPYEPIIGLSLALFARPGAMTPGQDTLTLDTQALAYQPTEDVYSTSAFTSRPVSTASEHLDGRNDQVLMWVRDYAEGRHDPASALGWERYTKSMPLYTQFAAHHTVSRLVEREWMRLARTQLEANAQQP